MITQIPQLVRSDTTFRTDVNNFFGGGLQTLVNEINETATDINDLVTYSLTSVTATSTTSVAVGTGSKSFTIETGKGFIVGMQVKVANTANVANYMIGAVSSYTSGTGALVVSVASSGGSGTLAAWTVSIVAAAPATPTMPILTRTSDTILALADSGKLVDMSGTWTQTFTAAATLGAGWYVFVRNTGTGVITLDPNSTELIDGLSTGSLASGMHGIIICTGSGFIFYRLGNRTTIELLTSGTSWTAPLGVRSVKVRAVGGGGSGGHGSLGTVYSGGGAGGYAEIIATVVPGTAYAYAIGAGGAVVGSGPAAGNAGGNTTGFGLTCNGGAGGVANSALTTAGGTASGGSVNLTGGYGTSVNAAVAVFVQTGGQSMMGEGGYTKGTGTPMIAPVGYGSGGACGSSQNTVNSTAGQPGCIILEY